MDRWEGKVAIVTGASAGIGAAIAEELVKAGLVVVGLARRLEKLDQLSASWNKAKGKFHARKCDVAKEEDLLDTFKWVIGEFGGVDILVNNAGVASNRKLIEDDTDIFRSMLDVNVLAIAIGIREAVASMKSRDAPGHIININSVLGHYYPNMPVPCSLYTASKFAVTAVTETARRELAAEGNDKIKLTSISPGIVKTEIAEISGYTTEFYKVNPYIDPKDIADAVLYVLGTPRKVQVTELTIRPVGETV